MSATEARAAQEQTTLALRGMTCAACAARVERTLNRLDGVEASVNFATEAAAVRYDDSRIAVDELVRAVEAAGYAASPGAERSDRRNARAPLTSALALTLPLVLVSMITQLQFGDWQWFTFALATPVVFLSGLRFHHAALLNALRVPETRFVPFMPRLCTRG